MGFALAKRKISFAAITGFCALCSYLFILSASASNKWRTLEHGNDKVKIGLLAGVYKEGNERTTELWTLNTKNGAKPEEFRSFRLFTVIFYAVLISATLFLAVGTLFIIWSSKPSLNVLGSLILYSLSLKLTIAAIVLDYKLNDYISAQSACSALLSQFKQAKAADQDCKWNSGTPSVLLLIGAALIVVTIGLALTRIFKYRLPFMTKVVEEILTIKALAKDDVSVMSPTARSSEPGRGPAGIRERIPLLSN
jgi:hypothetical protein